MIRLFLILILLLCSLPMQAQAAKRLALVVGNDSYRHISTLRNARADARAVTKTLEAAGFIVTQKEDLGEKGMKEALRNFKEHIEGGDDVVFYFSGHGVQLGAANYLLPVDIAGDSEGQVRDDALPLQRVLDDLQDQKARFTLAIVDACRNNPFKGRGRSIGGRGLMPVNPATGQMVLYSAGAGQEALDRLSDNDRNPNGVFTRILIKEMNQPGVPVDQVLREVRDQVVALAKGVNHDQVPALYDQAVGRFYLVPGEAAQIKTRPRQAPVVVDVLPSADPVEAAYWAEVSQSNDTDSYAAYLSTYPNGLHVADANEYIERDKQARAAKVKLKEDQAWQKAQSENSYASYAAYLKSYPGGRYAKLAELKLKKLGGAARDCPDCPEMVSISGGSFQMGSPSDEAGRGSDEGPQHRVSVAAFSLAKTEITRGQFAAFVNDSGHDAGDQCWTFEGGKYEERSGRNWRNPGYSQRDDHPVVCVNWQDAQAYTQWLSRKTGQNYRLPTEAEWEYAARAGNNTARPWGDSASQACGYANIMDSTGKAQVPGVTWEVHNCTDGHAYTAPTSSFTANAFGLHDMIGNVWEWTEDCYHDNYSGAPSDGSAWSGGSCEKRVLRGGSWVSRPGVARSAKRNWDTPARRLDNYGFRLARGARTY